MYCKMNLAQKSDINVCIANNGNNVDVTVSVATDQGTNPRYDWVMNLERRDSLYETWNVIGTRTGYTSVTSPSSRTFTDVKTVSEYIRVVLTCTAADGTKYMAYSPNIYR